LELPRPARSRQKLKRAKRHSQSTPSSPQRVCADGVGSLRLTRVTLGWWGFTGNPAVTGLLRRLPKCDVIVVRIDPVHRDAVRASPQRFADRGEYRQAAGAAETVEPPCQRCQTGFQTVRCAASLLGTRCLRYCSVTHRIAGRVRQRSISAARASGSVIP
jgi:hypothetical protein